MEFIEDYAKNRGFMTIQKLARECAEMLETQKRDNGKSYVAFKRDAPEWMRDMARDAHGDLLPDDFIYEYIAEALEAISMADDAEDIERACDELEPDVYTSGILKWLSARGFMCVDEALSDCGMQVDGVNTTLFDAVMLAQVEEKRRVFNAVVHFLKQRAEENE